jgi:hypothetical protein
MTSSGGREFDAMRSRFYRVSGARLEARFFQKGEVFPESERVVSRQGVWVRRRGDEWACARYAGASWRFVEMNPDVLYMDGRTTERGDKAERR